VEAEKKQCKEKYLELSGGRNSEK